MMSESSVEFCPVPQEQQPIYEYQQMQDSWFSRWATLDDLNYGKKLAWVGFWGLLLAAPIAAASFHPFHHPTRLIISSIWGSCFLLTLVLIRLYIGWAYIRDRLNNDKIFYEESGWYDGQVWHKPTNMINRDRLIVVYEIAPILQRLQRTFWLIGGLIAISGVAWLIVG